MHSLLLGLYLGMKLMSYGQNALIGTSCEMITHQGNANLLPQWDPTKHFPEWLKLKRLKSPYRGGKDVEELELSYLLERVQIGSVALENLKVFA